MTYDIQKYASTNKIDLREGGNTTKEIIKTLHLQRVMIDFSRVWETLISKLNKSSLMKKSNCWDLSTNVIFYFNIFIYT